ncbi:MAG: CAP domain-containing protein [Candidatus Paceibacterota bacterium]|jgi:hypothetical protein
MKKWLKKHFIPHPENDHRPHLLRADTARNTILVVLFFEITLFVIPALLNLNLSGGMAAVLPAVLGNLTNEERQELNLPTLTVNPLLEQAAQMKAQDMADKGYFAHTSPEGKTPWYWMEVAGYKYQYAGENLAVNFRDSEDVTRAWLASPTHRANIVKGNYTEMGTGIARGKYNGKATVFVAQVYANPMPAPIAKEIIPVNVPVRAFVATPTIKPQVLGTETVAQALEKNTDVAETPIKEELKFEAKVSEEPSPWHEFMASPRNTTNTILIVISGVMALALFFYLALRMKEHETDLVNNGLTVLAIALAVMIGNYYLTFNNMTVTASYDYALEDTI